MIGVDPENPVVMLCVAALTAYFQRIWDDALTSFQKAADSQHVAGTEPEREQP